MKKIGSVFFIFLLGSFHVLTAMDKKAVDKKHKEALEVLPSIYKYAKQHCWSEKIRSHCLDKKMAIKEHTLTFFLSACPCEPPLDFIKTITAEYVDQNYNGALRKASKKMFWIIGDYLLTNFRSKITWSVLEEFIRDAAYQGEYDIFKDHLPILKGKGLYRTLECAIKGAGDVNTVLLLLQEQDLLEKMHVYSAIKMGHFRLFDFLVKRFDVFNKFRPGGDWFYEKDPPLLHSAMFSKKNKKKIVEFLINTCEVDVFERDYQGRTPLQILLFYNNNLDEKDLEIAKLLLDTDWYYANEINIPFIRSHTYVNYYKNQILELVQARQTKARQKLFPEQAYTLGRLIWNDDDISIKDVHVLIEQERKQDYQRAFLHAVFKRRRDIVRFFLKGSFSISCNTKIKGIIIAIKKGYADLFEMIFGKINLRFIKDYALKNIFKRIGCKGNWEMMLYILSRMKGGFVSAALKGAARGDNKSFIANLVSNFPFPKKKLNKAALLAAAKGSRKTVEFLFVLGVSNRSAVFWKALKKRNKDVLTLFLDDDLDDDLDDEAVFSEIMGEKTFLHENDVDIFNMFIEKGFFAKDSFVACVKKALEMVNALLISRRSIKKTYCPLRSILKSGVRKRIEERRVVFEDTHVIKRLFHKTIINSSMRGMLGGIIGKIIAERQRPSISPVSPGNSDDEQEGEDETSSDECWWVPAES